MDSVLWLTVLASKSMPICELIERCSEFRTQRDHSYVAVLLSCQISIETTPSVAIIIHPYLAAAKLEQKRCSLLLLLAVDFIYQIHFALRGVSLHCFDRVPSSEQSCCIRVYLRNSPFSRCCCCVSYCAVVRCGFVDCSGRGACVFRQTTLSRQRSVQGSRQRRVHHSSYLKPSRPQQSSLS